MGPYYGSYSILWDPTVPMCATDFAERHIEGFSHRFRKNG